MVAERARWAISNFERRLPDLQSPDEVARGDVARSLCPCHAGWEVFEQNVGLVFRLLKDPSHIVRAYALHVFEDAARMMLAEEMRYYSEPGEERIGEKRCRFRSIEQRLEARKNRKIEKLKSRRTAAPRAGKMKRLLRGD